MKDINVGFVMLANREWRCEFNSEELGKPAHWQTPMSLRKEADPFLLPLLGHPFTCASSSNCGME